MRNFLIGMWLFGMRFICCVVVFFFGFVNLPLQHMCASEWTVCTLVLLAPLPLDKKDGVCYCSTMPVTSITKFIEEFTREREFWYASSGVGWLYALDRIDESAARQMADAVIAKYDVPYTYEIKGNIITWIRKDPETHGTTV
jgi:hypothetical protein